VGHDAGHGRVEAARLDCVARGVGFEVGFNVDLVNRGQPCVVAQPHAVGSLIHMQRNEAIDRSPVMMIVHELGE
jgi:hypothetical protein